MDWNDDGCISFKVLRPLHHRFCCCACPTPPPQPTLCQTHGHTTQPHTHPHLSHRSILDGIVVQCASHCRLRVAPSCSSPHCATAWMQEFLSAMYEWVDAGTIDD
jgi:hypothetical protein